MSEAGADQKVDGKKGRKVPMTVQFLLSGWVSPRWWPTSESFAEQQRSSDKKNDGSAGNA
jgi:hypothetical protein